MPRPLSLAEAYHRAVHAAAGSGLAAEPEAQLTAPVQALLTGLAEDAGLGELTLVREVRTGHTRPDFGLLHRSGHRQLQRGYLELKAPSVSVDAAGWTGRNARQFAQMAAEAEVLVVCNGRAARLYLHGQPQGLDALLPYDGAAGWQPDPLVALLRRLLSVRVSPVRSVVELSRRLAWRTADLRDKLLWLLDHAGPAGEMARTQLAAWRRAIHSESSARDFADGSAQVVSYGMVLAALSGVEADRDGDGVMSVREARAAIEGVSPVMSAAFGPMLEEPLCAALEVELGHLEALVSAIDADAVRASADPRGEPWLYFFEDFLGVYDPDERRQAGVYYTPAAVVRAMVAAVDHLLVERFGRRMGLASPDVVTLDPAVGTGTFPLEVVATAARRARAARGPAGPAQAAANLAQNLVGFELLPGPYAVSHLRLTEALRALDPDHPHTAQVLLTDTLESPEGIQEGQIPLFGAGRVLALEQNRAKRVKAQRPVTVLLGNPPYRRVARDLEGRGSGGWVLQPRKVGRRRPRSLFDDLLDVAKKETIFSHHASLYNLYVYFWRWALYKAFEAHGPGEGVVAFITASSWLSGPGFVGLRALVRAQADAVWVLDLGGDNKGANPEDNVFDIETPVAVVLVVRDGPPRPDVPADVRYRRIRGTRAEKLAAMEALAQRPDPLGGEWEAVPGEGSAPLVPPAGDADWQGYPALADLFPWQQPGCKVGRLWPIAPSPELLQRRWERFTDAPAEERPDLFQTSKYGRNIHTEIEGRPRLVDEPSGAPCPPVARYAYRSFDRQYTLVDPRVAALERPSLWRSRSERQLFLMSFLTKRLGPGAALSVSVDVPDLDAFCGRGGKDVIPLYRDAAATQPNLTRGLLAALGRAQGAAPPSPEDLAAYVTCLMSTPGYQARFSAELATPGPRVPLSADRRLWEAAVALGREVLWLQTWAEREQGEGRGRFLPRPAGLGWAAPVRQAPARTRDIRYDPDEQRLYVGDGVVAGVRPEVWGYAVSGMAVVPKWLGYRTLRGAGRAASSANPLDRIRPETWPDPWNDELLDLLSLLTRCTELHGEQDALLEAIVAGPLVAASALPQPGKAARRPPR